MIKYINAIKMRKKVYAMKREDYISDEEVVKRANTAIKIEIAKTSHGSYQCG